ncbi:MAG: hypothetical protein IH898_13665 [Planctomycetes bacterium]|nr:hypothetical protein [Planctomycetota bacterium]
MKRSPTVLLTILTLVLPVTTLVVVQTQVANGQQLRFQRPSDSRQAVREQQVNEKFRSPNATASKTTVEHETNVPPRVARDPVVERRAKPIAIPAEVSLSLQELSRDSQVAPASVRRVQHVPDLAEEVETPEAEQSSPSFTKEYPIEGIEMPYASCGLYADGGSCGCEVGCGMADACGGDCEPGCGCAEPYCGIGEPSCSCATTDCGGCVGLPGPDYWCFPVCLPRFKDLSFWGGVHGFRGPRDFYAPGSTVAGTRSDSNFGFQEGIGVSGRAPFIGLLFPQLSYQLGYQTVQSRLSGTVDVANDRTQQFVTAGFFRRVNTGLQFGVVWDLMSDDLYVEDDLHQIRSEISIKSPQGREIGVWIANSTNTIDVLGVLYETIDQYALFYRCNFGKSSNGRFWVGLTDDDGIFGAEFNTPINDRWSVQSGFNYLFTDKNAGLSGVSQESWNIGINLVWHLGRTARTCYRSPYRPLFSVADNGWMFVDLAGAN